MGVSSLQTIEYGCDRRMHESSFNCDAEVHGMYLEKLRSGLRRLNLSFLQFAIDFRDSALSKVHTRLRKMDNKVDDTHYKVDDIRTFLFKLKRSGTQSVSDTLARQEMPVPLKPEVFHGRDDMVSGIAKLLLHEETSRICILDPGGVGKTSITLPIKERFPGGNLVWVPCIEATSATLLLEFLYTQLQVPGDKQVTLEKIISDLETQKQPRLIVFDNFETPWNGSQKQVSDILCRLAMLNHIAAVLIVMCGKHAPCHNAIKWQSMDIKSTDEAASLRIYHDINPDSKNDPDYCLYWGIWPSRSLLWRNWDWRASGGLGVCWRHGPNLDPPYCRILNRA